MSRARLPGAASLRSARRLAVMAALLARWHAPLAAETAPESSEVVAVIHLHTSLGDGRASPFELARAARDAGVGALVITDHYLEKVTYAPWP